MRKILPQSRKAAEVAEGRGEAGVVSGQGPFLQKVLSGVGIYLASEAVSRIVPHVYAVLDTSVLVAGLRSRRGASFQVLQAIRAGGIRIAVSVALVLEYEAVLLRPGLIPRFTPRDIRKIVDGLCLLGDHQKVFFAWRPFLPDPDHDFILELAVAASASFIITHNTDDFRGSDSMGVRAITPATALNLIRP